MKSKRAAPLGARTIGWWLMALAAFAMAAYGLAYLVFGERLFVEALAESFRARPWGIYPHAFFGACAIAIGPFQFLRSLRRRRLNLHRALGKVYVAACLATGATGLYMAVYAHGGWPTHFGFGGMSLATLITTWVAYQQIRERAVEAHRRWMIRSYAVIFSAVTFRLWLPTFVLLYEHGLLYDDSFTPAYRWASWLAWVVNLVVAEWAIRRAERKAGARAERQQLSTLA